jgi:ABC-type phosphate/phosphonate transport system substrate-binding protein
MRDASTLVASLGMYDYPWIAEANDALWAAIASRLRADGVAAPEGLARGTALDQIWRNPQLVFGQTCGYPYVSQLRGQVAIVATPVYAFEGCAGPSYVSTIVAQKRGGARALRDFAGAAAAINAPDSNSGMNLFRATIAPIARGRPFFGKVVVTGSHEASLGAVSAGEADIAAIDCVSLALLEKGRPELLQNIAIVGRSPASPGLPFVISAALASSHLSAARAALFAALEDPAIANARATLGLVGAVVLDDRDYDRIRDIEREAVAAGYPILA